MWVDQVTTMMEEFASNYGVVYSQKERVISAYFEIGCLLALKDFYESNGFIGVIMNQDKSDGSYRYLTTPSGNPVNFSYLLMTKGETKIEIRQNVRILSHIGDDIAFTPDIIVLPENTEVRGTTNLEYACGKKRFFHVRSDEVIAAHECKSLSPFPELLVSFIGFLFTAHAWMKTSKYQKIIKAPGDHLAPYLFVGGCARPIHLSMIKGLKNAFPINIVVGMHMGTWDLNGASAEIRTMPNPFEKS